jgi:hypothetical protein
MEHKLKKRMKCTSLMYVAMAMVAALTLSAIQVSAGKDSESE